MYVTIDNEVIELSQMSKAFLLEAWSRYKRLSKAQNMSYKERKRRKKLRDDIYKELKTRHRTGHRMVFKPFID